MDVTYFLPVLYAFVACLGFGGLYNLHGRPVFWAAVGGALGWLAYLLSAPLVGSDLIQIFVASLVISIYSEVMARIRKCPVTGYLMIALFPLVPGGGIYYAMEYAINGETDLFLSTLLHTLGLAGSLAVGILLVSSAVRLVNGLLRRRAEHRAVRGE